MPPTQGAPGQYQGYQGYPPQGYQPYPPPKQSGGTPGWVLVGAGVALAGRREKAEKKEEEGGGEGRRWRASP